MASIQLINVKAFKDTGELELAPITIFVGQNSCGKSSLVRMPVVVSQTFASDESIPICLHDARSEFDYGNFEDIVHGHKGTSFSFGFSYEINEQFYQFDRLMNNSLKKRSNNSITEKKFTGKAKLVATFCKQNTSSPITLLKTELYLDEQLCCSYETVPRERKDSSYNQFVFKQWLTISDGKVISVNVEPETVNARILGHFIPINNKYSRSSTISKKQEIKELEEKRKGLTLAIQDSESKIEELKKKGFTGDPFEYAAQMDDHAVEYLVEQSAQFRESLREPLAILNALKTSLAKTDAEIEILSNELTENSLSYSVNDLLQEIARRIQQDFNNISYIGPFRSAPQRIYREDESVRINVGMAGEYTSSLLINQRAYRNSNVLNEINAWFEKTFNYKIGTKKIGGGYFQIQAINVKTDEASNLMDVGYGISQVLPIITQIVQSINYRYSAFPGRDLDHYTIIEQPEIHLHPAAQAELADLFSTLANSQKKKLVKEKLIIETHSEHLIRRLQVLIADPDSPLTSEMVKIYYVDRTEYGDSIVKEMHISNNGQFKEEWPSGFFDKAFELSRQLARANAERKKGSND